MQLLDAKVACQWFFDRDTVLRRVAAGKKTAMGATGAALRYRARAKLRRRKRSARPGEPPTWKATGYASLKTIFFQYEPAAEALVVGPVKLSARLPPPGGQTVPEVQEFGGQARVSRQKVVDVPAHPFMGPTLDESADLLVDFWNGSVEA